MSDDGSVVIRSLTSDDVPMERFEYHRPLWALALDPAAGARGRSRQFVTGGVAGELVMCTKGWLGPVEQVRGWSR